MTADTMFDQRVVAYIAAQHDPGAMALLAALPSPSVLQLTAIAIVLIIGGACLAHLHVPRLPRTRGLAGGTCERRKNGGRR